MGAAKGGGIFEVTAHTWGIMLSNQPHRREHQACAKWVQRRVEGFLKEQIRHSASCAVVHVSHFNVAFKLGAGPLTILNVT